MMSIKSTVPRTQLQQYSPNQEVNFDLFVDGEAFVPGTAYLTGRLVCENVEADEANYYDNYAGIASMFENVIVRCDQYQEIITNYARYVKMNNVLQYSTDSLCAGLKQSCELLAPHLYTTRAVLADAAQNNGMPFAHKFMNSLNNMSGNLSFAKAGRVQLSFKLAPPSKVFFGADLDANASYYLTDLELHYKSSPQAADSVTINVVEDTQKLIQTSDTTVQNTFINPVSRLVVSFANTTCETEETQNALACQHPPIERISWMYNDVSNRLVAYDIETTEEMVLSAITLLPVKGNGIDIREFQTAAIQNGAASFQDKFLIGLNLGQLMDFSRTPVGLNVRLTPGVAGIYAYFYGFGVQTIA